ncbi:hypothetical protein KM481_gp62 [Harp seal herpesvirus]|uniref:Small capsomere-interacting protein n=1 Tax=phocid gammaherpesvirus 3 TaxID=2560643 RepID=A0A0R5Z2P9_9GAMA|nr:hypothetical protein KM481_gp62 [Harp seal herpesvirus]AJG42992.1 hypothetical protein [Harp seal herpesvirus]
MSGAALKDPIVQDRLEDSTANPSVTQQLQKLPRGTRNDQDFAKIQKLYLTFLLSRQHYDEITNKNLGVRRKKHLEAKKQTGQGSQPISAQSLAQPTQPSISSSLFSLDASRVPASMESSIVVLPGEEPSTESAELLSTKRTSSGKKK